MTIHNDFFHVNVGQVQQESPDGSPRSCGSPDGSLSGRTVTRMTPAESPERSGTHEDSPVFLKVDPLSKKLSESIGSRRDSSSLSESGRAVRLERTESGETLSEAERIDQLMQALGIDPELAQSVPDAIRTSDSFDPEEAIAHFQELHSTNIDEAFTWLAAVSLENQEDVVSSLFPNIIGSLLERCLQGGDPHRDLAIRLLDQWATAEPFYQQNFVEDLNAQQAAPLLHWTLEARGAEVAAGLFRQLSGRTQMLVGAFLSDEARHSLREALDPSHSPQPRPSRADAITPTRTAPTRAKAQGKRENVDLQGLDPDAAITHFQRLISRPRMDVHSLSTSLQQLSGPAQEAVAKALPFDILMDLCTQMFLFAHESPGLAIAFIERLEPEAPSTSAFLNRLDSSDFKELFSYAKDHERWEAASTLLIYSDAQQEGLLALLGEEEAAHLYSCCNEGKTSLRLLEKCTADTKQTLLATLFSDKPAAFDLYYHDRSFLNEAVPDFSQTENFTLSDEQWILFNHLLDADHTKTFVELQSYEPFRRAVEERLNQPLLSPTQANLKTALAQFERYPFEFKSQNLFLKTLLVIEEQKEWTSNPDILQQAVDQGIAEPSQHYAAQGIVKLKRSVSGLPYTIAFYRDSGQVAFLQTELGKGAFKEVKKQLEFNQQQIFAIGKQSRKLETTREEIELTRECQDSENVAKLLEISTYRNKRRETVQVTKMHFYNKDTLEVQLHKEGEGSPLSEREQLGIASGIIQGTRDIHRHQIFHRDLKPANIFLEKDKEWRAVVGDLGLACRMSDPHAWDGLGTPLYLAPEMWAAQELSDGDRASLAIELMQEARREERLQVFSKQDAWAIGLILFQMRHHNVLPYERHNPKPLAAWSRQDLKQAIEKSIDDPDPVPNHDPHSLDYVIWRLTRPDPSERCTLDEAAEVIAALQNPQRMGLPSS